MCLPIDSCFGFGRPPTDDDHYPAPATKHHNGNGNGGGHYDGNGVHHYNGNGNGYGNYYNGNSYPAHGAAAAGAEADRKASNDGMRRGPAPAQQHAAPTRATDAATRGWHAHAATGAQEKADGTLKQQQPVARNGKAVADGAGARVGAPAPQHYYAYERAQPQPPAGRDAAADSYCMAATATADHQRY